VKRDQVGRWSLIFGAAGFGALAYIYLTLPDVRPLATTNPATTAFIQLRADEAHALGKPARRDQRWVRYERISTHLKRAVLVSEDSAFWQHGGVDLEQLKQSMEANLGKWRLARGGSTITQQLAKNLYLTPSRNPVRKLKELLITRRLEAALTKRRILEIYLNVIEWGDGVFGAEAASRAYFGKPAAALSADEAALLAGAIINPRVHSPAHPTARLRRRQEIIARRMGVKTSDAAPIFAPNSAAEPPRKADDSAEIPAKNQSDPEPPPTAQPMQPVPVNGVATLFAPVRPKFFR
jgi:monofunctional biosynthetic peptidoglycan transglycosylase